MYADKRRQKVGRKDKSRERGGDGTKTSTKAVFRTGRTGRNRAVVPVA